jgi:hypothetical protein
LWHRDKKKNKRPWPLKAKHEGLAQALTRDDWLLTANY